MSTPPISIMQLKFVCDALCDVAMEIPRSIPTTASPDSEHKVNPLWSRILDAADLIGKEIDRHAELKPVPGSTLEWQDLEFIRHTLFLRLDEIHRTGGESSARNSREKQLLNKVCAELDRREI